MAPPFFLQSIAFTSINSITLVFSDTIDPTAPANTNPVNYVITGGIEITGGFSISGSSVSFAVALAVVGKIYDIEVSSAVTSSEGAPLALPNRLSFFFGIGSVTPMLIGTTPNIGSLYMISDSAITGPILPTGNPTFAFGTVVGQAAINAYNELLAEIPPGGFYEVDVVTIPYATQDTDLLFVGVPGVTYGLFLNNIFVASTVANFQGWAGFQITMPQGAVAIQVLGNNSVTPFSSSLVASKFMDWQGAIADSLGQIDASIQQVYDARGIATVTSDDIQSNFGAFVQTPRVSNYSLEVYRALLIEIIQAFLYYSATLQGLHEVVAAFTQVRPITKWFRRDAPRWILGWQHFINREMTQRYRFASSNYPSTDITATGCSGSNEDGTASLLFDPVGPVLQYEAVGGTYGAPVTLTGPGTYTVFSGDGISSVTVQVGAPLPVVSVVIPVTVTGPTLPLDVTVTNATILIVPGALMQRSGARLQVTATGSNPSIALQADPTFFEHLGEYFVASWWVYQATGSTRHFIVEFSYDDGVTWFTPAVAMAVPSGAYTRVDAAQSLAYFGITNVMVRVRGTDVNPSEVFYLEKAALHSPQTGGLYLGENTRARSRRRKYFGYQLLMFFIEPLEIEAFTTLGLQPSLGWGLDPWGDSPWGSPSYGYFGPVTAGGSNTASIGLIPYIIPTMCEVDTFQDSVTTPGGIVNVVGVMYEADWRAGTYTNFTVVPQVPDRFSYIMPTVPSIFSETVEFDGGGLATFSQVSTQNQDISQLLENGVPIPNNEWDFASDTSIQLLNLGDLDPTAVYTFTYPTLTMFTSAVLDLGVNFPLFNWYADWYEYNRMTVNSIDTPQAAQLIFSSVSLIATLPTQANTTASTTTLTQNLAGVNTVISTALWSFITPNTVKIDSSAFNPLASYAFSYTAQALVKKVVVTSVVQVKYSVDNITWSDWITITNDAPFGNSFRYFQFQATISGLVDAQMRDYKLRSLTLKGDPLNRSTIQSLLP